MAFSMRSSLICILTLTGGVMEVKTELSPVAEGVSPDGAIELGGSCEDNPKGCAEGSSCGLVSQLCVSTTSSMAEKMILESLKLIEDQQERSRGTNPALNILEEAIWKVRHDITPDSTHRVFEAFTIAQAGLEFHGEELVAMDKLYDDLIASLTPEQLVAAGKLYDDLIASQLVAGTNPVLKILQKNILWALWKVRPDITPDLARRVPEASIAQEGLEEIDEFDEEAEKLYDDLTASVTPEELAVTGKLYDDLMASATPVKKADDTEDWDNRRAGTNPALKISEKETLEAIRKARPDITPDLARRVPEASIAQEGLEEIDEFDEEAEKLYDDLIASVTPEEIAVIGKLYDDLIASAADDMEDWDNRRAGTNPALKILQKETLEALWKVRPDMTPDLARRDFEASIAQEGLEDEFDKEVEKLYDDQTASLTPEQLVAGGKLYDDLTASATAVKKAGDMEDLDNRRAGAIELGGSCKDNPKGCAEGSSCGLVSQLCVSTTSSMAENIILAEAIWKVRHDTGGVHLTRRVFEAFTIAIAQEGLEFNREELVAIDKLYDDLIASITPEQLVAAGKLYDDLIASPLVAGAGP